MEKAVTLIYPDWRTETSCVSPLRNGEFRNEFGLSIAGNWLPARAKFTWSCAKMWKGAAPVNHSCVGAQIAQGLPCRSDFEGREGFDWGRQIRCRVSGRHIDAVETRWKRPPMPSSGIIRSETRRDGRVAEGGGLLNRYRVKSSIGGSNPPLSARHTADSTASLLGFLKETQR
jgi:hypothetical protein